MAEDKQLVLTYEEITKGMDWTSPERMQREHLSEAAHMLQRVTNLTGACALEINRVCSDRTKRLDLHQFTVLIEEAVLLLTHLQTAQALRDFRKRLGEFDERA